MAKITHRERTMAGKYVSCPQCNEEITIVAPITLDMPYCGDCGKAVDDAAQKYCGWCGCEFGENHDGDGE